MTEPVNTDATNTDSGDNAVKKDVETLSDEVAKLSKQLSDAMGQLTSEEYLEFLAQKKSKGGAEEKEASARSSDVDLEMMSATDLVQHVLGLVDERISNEATSREGAIQSLVKEIGNAFGGVDLELTKVKHSDFGWEDESAMEMFTRISKDNPKWRAERVLKEVKREMRDAEDAQKQHEAEQREKELAAATEKPGVSNSVVEEKELSLDEAVEQAARLAFGAESVT